MTTRQNRTKLRWRSKRADEFLAKDIAKELKTRRMKRKILFITKTQKALDIIK
ncbi:MAG: hypothetical protein LBM12_00710 [Candidatus Nomurabacteria bacterium]|nr:hypothetical protein [Candidatus Nomurabacteria bacterium]